MPPAPFRTVLERTQLVHHSESLLRKGRQEPENSSGSDINPLTLDPKDDLPEQIHHDTQSEESVGNLEFCIAGLNPL